jgi:uncharacterized membrane protein YeaQ/YmgE (transglycosylase-associated protein family)
MSDQTQAFVASLVVGFGFGALGRAMLRRRVTLGWSDAIVAGLVGAACGSLVAGVFRQRGAAAPLLSALVAVASTVAVLLLVEHRRARRRLPQGTVAELVAHGETQYVEFKSSARYNRRSGRRDDRMEAVVAKTIAGFLNAEGGLLLIGIADDGTVTGLDDDYPLLKSPSRDHFELWLRDMLSLLIGPLASASVRVAFDDLEGHDVCVVTALPAARPVYLRVKGQPAALYVRMGNSTRQLAVDEAMTYSLERWGRRAVRRASVPASS